MNALAHIYFKEFGKTTDFNQESSKASLSIPVTGLPFILSGITISEVSQDTFNQIIVTSLAISLYSKHSESNLFGLLEFDGFMLLFQLFEFWFPVFSWSLSSISGVPSPSLSLSTVTAIETLLFSVSFHRIIET